MLADLNTHDLANLRQRGLQVRQAIMGALLPSELKRAIVTAYDRLCTERHVPVVVRSSATAEDLPDASFAGQQETYLNVQAYPMLLDTCKRCFASLFTARAIAYQTDKGFDHFSIALSIGVQRSDYLEFAQFLVEQGIDSISLNPDAVLKTTVAILEMEKIRATSARPSA